MAADGGPETVPRYSLQTILGCTALCAFFLAALVNLNLWWEVGTEFVTASLVTAAAVDGILRGRAAPFSIAFAVGAVISDLGRFAWGAGVVLSNRTGFPHGTAILECATVLLFGACAGAIATAVYPPRAKPTAAP
jgi:hypothetical protein